MPPADFDSMAADKEEKPPVLHVVVVGFHHKKGCQVEYSYPPLVEGQPVDSHEVPPEWKYLPSLALPDGAHNYTQDTVYFHLPSRGKAGGSTVYGVSCYRQMDAQKLVKKGADVTRNTVQKCVVVLSHLPLYGLIQAKLELITHAYFDERDFSQTSLLHDTYTNLNASLTESLLQQGSQVFLGLSCRDVVQQLKHRIVILFKLMLLERKVLFFSSPVQPICTTLLSIISLFPDMIEHGLGESAKYTPNKAISPTLHHTRSGSISSDDYLEVRYSTQMSTDSDRSCHLPVDIDLNAGLDGCIDNKVNKQDDSDSKDASQGSTATAQGESSSASHVTLDNRSKDERAKDKVEEKMETSVGNVNEVSLDPLGAQKKVVGSEAGTAESFQQGLNHGVNKTDNNTMTKHKNEGISAAEEDLPDLVGAANMENLLETEEEALSFEEDKLLLEIDAALEDEIDEGQPVEKHSPVDLDAQVHYFKGTGVSISRSTSVDSADAGNSSKSNVLSTVTFKAAKLRERLSSQMSTGSQDSMELQHISHPIPPTSLNVDSMGFPLEVFTKGILCHPYLCLQNYDLLSDVNVRGFVVGATNMLFKQKKHLVDVVVEISENKLEVHDPELRRQLSLTTADLRFADYLVTKSVVKSDSSENIYLQTTEWEGGDEWIRAQFLNYLMSLLATVTRGDERSVEDFNTHFVSAWKSTHNYKVWKCSPHPGLEEVIPGHPFHGQMGMSDMKLKLSHSMQSTERGKKLNAAVSQTGKVVVQTGKVVGGALTSAKSAVSKTVSSWFSNFSKEWNQPDNVEQAEGN